MRGEEPPAKSQRHNGSSPTTPLAPKPGIINESQDES
jgi:hypothetical protein